MTTVDAPPPPLQMLATPYSPALRAYTKWLMIRHPDILKSVGVSSIVILKNFYTHRSRTQ